MTSVEEIEQHIKSFLLTDITFNIDDKQIKSGKLLLFCIKDFFCVFTLLQTEKNNKRIVYEIPYPFNISKEHNNLIFDYTLNSFCLNNPLIKSYVNKLSLKKTSKLFNKKLVVTSTI